MNYFIASDEDNVMVFTETALGCLTIAAFAESCGVCVNDVCEVKDEECQYYCYSPVWLEDERKVEIAKKRAKKWIDEQSEEQISAFCKRIGLKVPRTHRGYLMPLELR